MSDAPKRKTWFEAPTAKAVAPGMKWLRTRQAAAHLNIKQPSVSKIEKQADMYLSTLRSYVEAVGGKLELTVKLPSHPVIHLCSVGDIGMGDGTDVRTVARRRKQGVAR